MMRAPTKERTMLDLPAYFLNFLKLEFFVS